MSTLAMSEYTFAPRDTVERFTQPLMYFGWDEHMMFAAPPLPAKDAKVQPAGSTPALVVRSLMLPA